ncbi:Os01g0692500, partial [Oryza sativa Japonica Group]
MTYTNPRRQVKSNRIGGHSREQHQRGNKHAHLRRRAVPPEREPPLCAGHGHVVQLIRRADRGLRPLLARGGRGGEGAGWRRRGWLGRRRGRRRGAVGGEGPDARRRRGSRRGRGGRGGGARGGGGGGEVREGGAGEEDAEVGRVEERHGGWSWSPS